MDMTGEYRIEAPRDKVWAALNDPEVLKQSIPGCEELVKESDTAFSAKVKAKVGPVSAKFAGRVELTDINPPESYRISGEGQGGVAGFAKGGANVRLVEDGAATVLHYEVQANVGGKLAQIGSRLIDSSAKKMAGQFFENFTEVVEGQA
jgi:carbon monoxide dehydrogenase subunit G